MKERNKQITTRAKTRQEMADEYGIGRKTFYRWMKRAGIQVTNGLLYPLEIEVIYNTFGNPYSADKEDRVFIEQSKGSI